MGHGKGGGRVRACGREVLGQEAIRAGRWLEPMGSSGGRAAPVLNSPCKPLAGRPPVPARNAPAQQQAHNPLFARGTLPCSHQPGAPSPLAVPIARPNLFSGRRSQISFLAPPARCPSQSTDQLLFFLEPRGSASFPCSFLPPSHPPTARPPILESVDTRRWTRIRAHQWYVTIAFPDFMRRGHSLPASPTAGSIHHELCSGHRDVAALVFSRSSVARLPFFARFGSLDRRLTRDSRH